ncbi:hypothetical protein COCOR_02860 [Corallococcus coralloides DSM 2259]|uniref:Uncharacterized protein n=1 Tax=Corallococcus coralloides (strain ATCC 25202 / DSM 2259 / NBRC 100086 / M2) TaxID=1144275 RepID=H8MX68_CORCM|nr:hypothetical protein [Corallococcus coralloides]AFE04876.1 hypothetical protein COCOR_02860 [Corallococcus coralloides DSM 2259]
MAVVINEMEVVSEPPPATPPGGGKGEEKAPASGVQRAHELGRGLERHRERMERVRAH